jgi:hypothetical protein
MDHDFAPVLAIFCIFGLPIIAYIIIKILAHAERIELIRRGYAPPPDGNWKKATLRDRMDDVRDRVGARTMGDPMPPPPPYAGPAPGMYDLDGPQRQLNKGIMVALIGLAITIGMSFINMDNSGPLGTPSFHPGPELLAGLIPMFVGIAQIITAILGGAQFGFRGARGFGNPGGGPMPGPGATGSPFSQPGRPYAPPPPPPPRPNPADELPHNNPLDRR